MKKVLLILALVAVYGISISNVSAKVITVEKSKVTVVASNDDNSAISAEKEEAKKEKGKKNAKAEKTAPAKACCGEKPATKAACSKSAKKSCRQTLFPQEKILLYL